MGGCGRVKLEQQWLTHLGHHRPRFPREIAHPTPNGHFWRRDTQNPQTYCHAIDQTGASYNTYAALYTERQRQTHTYDKIYLDIDAPDFYDAHESAVAITQTSLQRYGQKPRTYVSGAKGLNIMFDFEPAEMTTEQMRIWALDLANDSGATIDTSVLGDKRRVSRVPYTYNYNALEKFGRPTFCVPVDVEWGADRVLDEKKNPTITKPVTLSNFPEVPAEVRDAQSRTPRQGRAAPDGEPPSVDSAHFGEVLDWLMQNAIRVNDGRHRILTFVIVPALLDAGLSREEVHDWCKEWVTRSGEQYRGYANHVDSSIRRTRRDGWAPWNLETLLARNPEIADQLSLEV